MNVASQSYLFPLEPTDDVQFIGVVVEAITPDLFVRRLSFSWGIILVEK